MYSSLAGAWQLPRCYAHAWCVGQYLLCRLQQGILKPASQQLIPPLAESKELTGHISILSMLQAHAAYVMAWMCYVQFTNQLA
jgi:hypothetical protein